MIDIAANLDGPWENGCAEVASLLAESCPELLYPHLDFFAANLESKQKVVRWEAVCTLRHLAVVDGEGRVVPLVERMLPLLRDRSILLQGHTVRALARVAAAHPSEADHILDALIAARDAFPGNRIGFVVEAMAYLVGVDRVVNRVRRFVQPYQDSEIPVVARKATRVMKLIDQHKPA
jgi:hypothetical protein